MNEEIQQLALDLRSEIGRAKELTSDTSFHEIFMSAETIIGILAYLISPIALLEQRYRTKIVEYMDEGDSHAKAEARAKAGDEYMEWRKYAGLVEIGNQQVLLLKKFRDLLAQEYDRL